MGNYNVRKVSDLDEAMGSPWSGDMFYISRPEGETSYSSKKISFETIDNCIVSDAVDISRREFGISPGINVSADIVAKLDALSGGQFTISAASFVETPTVKKQPDVTELSGDMLVTKDTVIALVDADKSYISLSSSIDCMPDNSKGYTKTSKNLLTWHFNPSGRDSSEWAA